MIHALREKLARKLSFRKFGSAFFAMGCVCMLLCSQSAGIASALSPAQRQVYDEGINLFDVSTCGGGNGTAATGDGSDVNTSCTPCSSDGSAPGGLTGNGHIQEAFNFFVTAGLTAAQSAGIVANLYNESSIDPTSGAPPRDGIGFGIAQWTFTARQAPLEAFAAAQHKPVTDLLTQLQFVWHELNTDYKASTLDKLKQITGNDPASAGNAAVIVRDNYESCDMSYTSCSDRESVGEDTFKQLGGGGVTTGSSGGSSGTATDGSCQGSTGISPDCQNATANAKILCDAKLYDSLSYSQAWHMSGSAFHTKCPQIGPSCATDCSGLVNIAIYDVFKNDINENTYGEAADSTNWKHISFNELQPGDLIQPAAEKGDHVEIVDHVSGSTIYTFGAHDANRAQAEQVSPDQFSADPGDVYLRYKGEGS